MSKRPASPAAIEANTLLCKPGVLSCTGAVPLAAGANSTPALTPVGSPAAGERASSRTLLSVLTPGHAALPWATPSYAMYILPPAVGLPSTAYHWRPTSAPGTLRQCVGA